MVRGSYRHLGEMFVEMIRMPRLLHTHNVSKYALHHRDDDLQKIHDVVATGRPPITVTGHFGNWEILSYLSGLMGFRA